MTRRTSKALGLTFYLTFAFSLISASLPAFSQEQEIRPVTLGEPMPDFTLPIYQGGEITLSSLRGKNVLLIFPRGYAAEGRWCTVCHYKYAELLDFEKNEELRKNFDLEILYVLPYPKDVISQWLEVLPDQLEKIKGWKYPAQPESLDEQGKIRMERSRKGFPKDLSLEKGQKPAPFPILIDEQRKVTKGLGIFATEWSGSKADQAIPSVFILDKKGIVQFKYIGQNTWDRPSYEYLTKILEMIADL
ncbi:MAG: redoxin domain-containing protein [Clostridiales bacterium]|jgi:peroxiredoxin|nr:redoxin domain-containing protein [Clostridiales bacterium]